MQPSSGPGPAPSGPAVVSTEVLRALEQAYQLTAQGEPLQALRVVAELLQAVGLERQAGESISRVQQALAAGSTTAAAAEELAGLLSMVSLQQAAQPFQQAQPAASHAGSQPPPLQQQQQHLQQQHWQQQLQQQQQQQVQAAGGPTGMDLEGSCRGGTGPGPPLTGASSEHDRLDQLVAAAEGPSYVCAHCGGVVAMARQAAHEQLWCPALPLHAS